MKNRVKAWNKLLLCFFYYLIPITPEAPYLSRFFIKNENISNVLPNRYEVELARNDAGGTKIFLKKLENNLTAE